MKNHPLSLQIWLVIATVTLAISIIFSFLLPYTLRAFFTKEIYASIYSSQALVFDQFSGDVYRDYIGSDFFGDDNLVEENIRAVKHTILMEGVSLNIYLPEEFLDILNENISTQVEDSKEYSAIINDEKIFYIASKGTVLNTEAFLVSYMTDSYREDLVITLLNKLIHINIIALFLSWIPSILLSRYLSRPLVSLEKKVNKLAHNQWNEPIELNRKDEIGKLGDSIEYLRKQLIRQDEAERSFLQHVSHELKTPVMVIQSFTEAIKDGIYPKDTLEDSLDIITEESQRLEKRIKDLLYLNKLDYMLSHDVERLSFSLDGLIKDIANKFQWKNQSIKWNIDLIDFSIVGNIEQWKIAIENILDNQMRYAKNTISITLTEDKILKIYNDGPSIEKSILEKLFLPFSKGVDGEFGLGLAIVNKIVLSHGFSIDVENQDSGVCFYIKF